MLVIAVVTSISALSPRTSSHNNAQNREGMSKLSSAGQFQVPYRLTDTNHFLVRVRLNGKGPFNFLVDSGAPALFIATETAKKIGLRPKEATSGRPSPA